MNLAQIIGVILIVFSLLWIVVLMFAFRRTNKVSQYRQHLIKTISELNLRDLNKIHEYTLPLLHSLPDDQTRLKLIKLSAQKMEEVVNWRWRVYDSVSFDELTKLTNLGKPIDSFYPDKEFIDLGRPAPRLSIEDLQETAL